MIDFNTAGLDPAVAELVQAMTQRARVGRAEAAGRASGQPEWEMRRPSSSDISRLRVQNILQDGRIRDDRLSRLNPSLGVMAPLVAGLQGLAKHIGRGNDQRTLDEAFALYNEDLARERAEQ